MFLFVTIFVMRLNPKYFYRRMLSWVIPAGILVEAAGFTFDVIAKHKTGEGGFRWEGAASGWFFAAWAVVIVGLIVADLKTAKPD